MSAITAVVALDRQRPVSDETQRISQALSLYGPDRDGDWSSAGIGLGWNARFRLPEDPVDRQPRRGDSGVRLVADVRLDNRDELAPDLSLDPANGRLPDSAIVLAAWERWGEDCVLHLEGAFAIAIWDARERRLFCARDPLGERPLFYFQGQNLIAFASMPRGLLALPEVPTRINETAVADKLLLLPDLNEDYYYEGVQRLLPGQSITVRDGQLSKRRYWQPDIEKRITLAKDSDYVEACRELLYKSTRAKLRVAGDGNIASTISGGLDSTTITIIASDITHQQGKPLVAITGAPPKGFDGPVPGQRFGDESDHAAAVAATLPNVEHIIRRSQPQRRYQVDRMEERHALSSAIAWGLRAGPSEAEAPQPGDSLKDRGVKVVLTGGLGNMTVSHAGDEVLPGLLMSGQWRTLAHELRASARRPEVGLARGLYRTVMPVMPRSLWRLLHNRMRGRPVLNYDSYTPINTETYDADAAAERARRYDFDLEYNPWKDSRAMRATTILRIDHGTSRQAGDAQGGIPRMDPFYDRRLIEFCLAIPENQYFRHGISRWLIRRLMHGRMPKKVLYEHRRGWQDANWYEAFTAQRDELRAELVKIQDNATARRLIDIPALIQLMDDLPSADWADDKVLDDYQCKVLRGIEVGRFIADFERANR